MNIGANLQFTDDGPDISAVLTGTQLRIDETDGVVAAGGEVDPVGGNLGSVSVAAATLVTISQPHVSADAPTTLAYSLVLSGPGVDSGLDVSSNNASIFLYSIGNTVYGSTAATQGTVDTVGLTNVAFTVSIDPVTGQVTMTQYQAIEHPTPGASHDEASSPLAAGALNLRVTATDYDGDTDFAQVDLGSVIRFEDDGPSVTQAQVTGTVDEDGVVENYPAPNETRGDGIAGGTNPEGLGSFADVPGEDTTASGSVAAMFNSGSDTPLTYGFAANAETVLEGLGLTSNGVALDYEVAGNMVTASTAAGDVFTFELNANGTWEFTLIDQLDHPTLDNQPGDNQENDLTINLGTIVQATDADGDTVVGAANGLVITVDDDTPVAIDDTPTLVVAFDPLGVEDIEAQWTNTEMQGGASPTGFDRDGDGVTPDEIRWGTPVNQGGGQSGYGFVDNPSLVSQTVLTNQPFSLGTFTHYNNPINGDELLETTLTVNFTAIIDGQPHEVGPIEIDFDHTETTNTNDPDESRDVINISAQTITVNIDGVDYELEVLGLVDEMGDVVTEVRTFEGQANNYELMVQFVNTETFELPGNVLDNDFSGADEPIEVVAVSGVTSDSRPHGDGDTAMEVEGQYGTLTINADGSYVYTLETDPADLPDDAVEHFSYTIEDADGDGTTAELDITLDIDKAPTVTDGEAASDDDGVTPFGNADNATGDLNANTGEGAPGHVSEAIFTGQFVASGGDGALTYSLANMNGLSGTVGTETVEYSWNGATNTLTAAVDGGTRDGTPLFQVQVTPATGQYTLTQLANVLHANEAANQENDATTTISFRVTDSDGDAVFGDLEITFDDDMPRVNLVTDPLNIANEGPTPSGTGDFSFDIGADQNADFNDISVSGFTISINGQAADNVVLFANQDGNGDPAPETADTASYRFTFEYDTGTGGTAQGEGTLVFNKDTGKYTVELTSGPIAGFTLASTGGASVDDFVGHDAPGAPGGSDEIQNVQIADDLFIQFTSANVPNNGTFQTVDLPAIDPDPAPDGDPNVTWVEGEIFTDNDATAEAVIASSAAIGASSNTLQNEEMIDFNLYESDPGPTTGAEPTTSAGEMFIQFDQISNVDDLVVILKLVDTVTGEFTTKAIIVDAADLYRGNSAADEALLNGTPYESLANMGNNEGLLVIQSNDYNGVGENWEIVGGQILTGETGVSGTGINLNRGFGDTGGSSVAQAFSTDTDVGGAKIMSIGFLIDSVESQSATIEFDVTISDADGDQVATNNVTVNIGAAAEPLLAEAPTTKLAANSTQAANDDFSSLLVSDSEHRMGGNSFGNVGSTGITSAMVAASGLAMMSGSLQGFNDASSSHLVQNDFQSMATQVVRGVEDSPISAMSLGNDLGGSHIDAVSLQSSGFNFADRGFGGGSLDSIALGNAEPAFVPSYASGEPTIANVAAFAANVPTVSMASAEMLRAANVDGELQQGGGIEQVLADALGGAPTIDAVLANLPGGNVELAAISHLASGGNAGVPAWDMGMQGGFSPMHDMLFKVAAVAVHHDAVQPA